MASKRERQTDTKSDREEEAAPDPEQSSTSADSTAEASSKAADKVKAIDEVLEDFDNQTLAEFGFRKEDVVDPAEINKAIKRKLDEFKQKGGQ